MLRGHSGAPAVVLSHVLAACPFCREMIDGSEGRSCSVCGIAVVPFDRLPPSRDTLEEDDVPRHPEHDPLPVLFFGRGRGLLALLALAGLCAFVSPWVHVTLPDVLTYSGVALARRLGWAWGGGVAWCVLIATVLSRRTIAQMRGARLAAVFLTAVPGVTALVLLVRPPHGSHGVVLRFAFGAGLYETLVLSAIALAVACSFGGRADDIGIRRGSSRGQLVH